MKNSSSESKLLESKALVTSLSIALIANLIVMTVITLSPALAANPQLSQGIALFNQKKYAQALKYFHSAVPSSRDGVAAYYEALCYHYAGDKVRAKLFYAEVVKNYPGSQSARMSDQALRQLDPRYGRTSSSSYQSYSGGSSSDTLPEQTRVYYEVGPADRPLINVSINGRTIKMLFDTGASGCVLGKNHLRELGIAAPTGAATGKVGGVGSTESMDSWNLKADVKVGTLEKKNFPITIQDDLNGDPLLGQTFVRDYQYTIDKGAKTITFTKKSSGSSSASSGSSHNEVPFVVSNVSGHHLIVTAEVNGRRCPMIFDTGADGITFTKAQANQMGITVPDDAEESTHTGVSGSTKGYDFTIHSIKLGPIYRQDIKISVIENSIMQYPLLGRSLLGNWQYTIDNDRKVIKFLAR